MIIDKRVVRSLFNADRAVRQRLKVMMITARAHTSVISTRALITQTALSNYPQYSALLSTPSCRTI